MAGWVLRWVGPLTVSRSVDPIAVRTLGEVVFDPVSIYWERLILIEAVEKWLEATK